MTVSDNVSMFYNARPIIFERAKILRLHMTDAEKLLWEKLRKKQILGLRFRAQHPIDIFIADFYCHKIKLVVEVDGRIHKTRKQRQYDLGRTAEMGEYGITVIRFTNEQVSRHIDSVIHEIEKTCKTLLKRLPKDNSIN